MDAARTGHEPRAGTDDLHPKQPRAIHSALIVLEEVAKAGPGVTARELSIRLGLPRATTYRLVNLLVKDEYLVRLPDISGFALGRKVAELAQTFGATAHARPPRAARELIAELRSELRGIGVHLFRYEHDRVVPVDVDPDFPLRNPFARPAHETRSAAGRLWLARHETPRRDHVLQQDALAPGYACIAVAIHDDDKLIGALCAAGRSDRIETLQSLVPRLRTATRLLAPLID